MNLANQLAADTRKMTRFNGLQTSQESAHFDQTFDSRFPTPLSNNFRQLL